MLFSRILRFVLVILLVSFLEVAQANVEKKNQSPVTKIMQCSLPVFEDIAQGIPEVINGNIRISSLQASIEQDQTALFNGSVILVDKNQKIIADQLSFNRLKMQIEALGNIHYQGKQINIFANTLSASKIDSSTEMTTASYQLDGNPG
ncbi:MAG TPA: LPS-assembly protein LptD, partial [Colwellia sp.]|nr:LPS-assembly protein LptD [Colwellia sp.]